MAIINGTGVLIGTQFNDTITGGAADDNLSGLAGNDTLTSSTGNDILDGGTGNDILSAGDGNNVLLGGLGNDTLTAGIGNDRLDGGAGIDTMTGGDGSDTYIVDNALDVVIEGAGQPGDIDIVEASASYTLSANVENLTLLGAGSINGTGNASDNVITGNAGANHLDGGAGNDTIDGGLGIDTMTGGLGNDLFIANVSTDKVIEGTDPGYDTVIAGSNYVLPANVEALILSDQDFNINGTGNALDNVIWGNSKDNTLDGGAGADTMIGGGSALDTLLFVLLAQGGTPTSSTTNTDGNDVYIVDNNNDVIIELANSGTDTARSSAPSFNLATNGANVENLVLTGTSAINGTGNALDNVITGNSATNTLDGGAGNDTYIVQNATDVVLEAAGAGTDIVQSSVSYSLNSAGNAAQEIEILTLTGTAAINGTGNVLANTITGNGGANILDGQGGDDTMFGGAGNDTVIGGAGNDTLDPGTGVDTLIGGDGNDVYIVTRATGITIIESGAAVASTHDLVNASVTFSLAPIANVEDLTLTGAANINGTGNAASNIITGNTGNNTLDGGAGADTMLGGGGTDVFLVDNSGDQVLSGTGTVISGANYDMSINALTVANLTLTGAAVTGTGNALDNIITGNALVNTLDGKAGNDTYVIGSNDIVNDTGGDASDTIQVAFSANLATLALSNQVLGVENITLTGTTALNATGDGGNNILTGNSAINTLDGGAGNDTYFVTAGDVIVDSSGTDTVFAGFSYTLGANLENLTLTGISNINGTGNALDNIITGNAHDNTLDGGGNIVGDTLIGGLGNDTYIVHAGDVVTENPGGGTDTIKAGFTYDLSIADPNIEHLTLTGTGNFNGTGNTLENVITGNSGNNVLDGGTGADSMIGGLGNDTFMVDNAGDHVSDIGGHDTVMSTVSFTLPVGLEDLQLTGTTVVTGTGNASANLISVTNVTPGDDVLLGMGGNDTLIGGIGNDTLDGGTGFDTLIGGAGNDTYFVDSPLDVVSETINGGTDTVSTSASNFVLPHDVENLTLTGKATVGTGNSLDNVITGDAGNNILHGGDGNDTIDGGAGTDFLYGDLGNDTLHGGAGLDVMTGGGGADTFVFTPDSAFTNIDKIADYNVLDNDVLDISALIAGTFIPGTSDFHNFVRVAGQFLQVDVTGSGSSWQNVADLEGPLIVNESGVIFKLV